MFYKNKRIINKMKTIKSLTIAGTDPTGGAGIQSDIKVFAALKSYGSSVITSLVAQNTCGIQDIMPIKPNFILKQLDSVINDIKIDSCKIGMVFNNEIIKTIYNRLNQTKIPWIILDTVMVSTSNHTLLLKNSIKNFCKYLIPIASIITPNLKESAIILNTNIANSEEEMKIQGRNLLKIGAKAVLLKGGHLKSKESPDWLFIKSEEIRFSAKRIKTKNYHGTGCSLSAALTALIPRYNNWTKTVLEAKKWIQGAIENSKKLNIGKGKGPINHFYKWW